MLPLGGGRFVFKLHDAVLVVLQVLEGLGKLVVEAAKETLRLSGLLLECAVVYVVTITTCIRETLGRRFHRSDIALSHADVARSRSLRISFHVRLGDGIGLQHGGVRRGRWLLGSLLDNCFSSLDDLDGAWLTVEQLIDEDLLVTLLPGEVLNRHLKLVERVLHAKQVVQIEWEVQDGFRLCLRRVCLSAINVGVTLFFVFLHLFAFIYILGSICYYQFCVSLIKCELSELLILFSSSVQKLLNRTSYFNKANKTLSVYQAN